MRNRIIRLAAILPLVLGPWSALPRAAEAHAFLVRCAGLSRNAKVAAAPKTLTCTFAEGVDPKGSFLRIVEATGDGAEVDRENSAVSFSNAHQMTVSVATLARGAYYLMWFTISADDGHKAGGVLPFTIT